MMLSDLFCDLNSQKQYHKVVQIWTSVQKLEMQNNRHRIRTHWPLSHPRKLTSLKLVQRMKLCGRFNNTWVVFLISPVQYVLFNQELSFLPLYNNNYVLFNQELSYFLHTVICLFTWVLRQAHKFDWKKSSFSKHFR